MGGTASFALADSVAFGWLAYTPLHASQPGAYHSELLLLADGSVHRNRQHAVGAGVAVLGPLVLAGLGGRFLGRRSGRRAT